MCLAPMTLSTKSGHVQACRLVHGLYMANLTKCFDMLHFQGWTLSYETASRIRQVLDSVGED